MEYSTKLLVFKIFNKRLISFREEYEIPVTGTQEDSVRQTVQLAEEFLNLLILIISERYVPGLGQVTSADVVKREIIHQLCIKPLAHSELSKSLPEDVSHLS